MAPSRDILVVEDDEGHAALMLAAFEREGQFTVRVASTLARAARELERRTTELIVADLRLPDGLGTELIHPDGGPPLIVLTAQGDEMAAATAMKAGAIDYLVKSQAVLAAMPQIVVRALREHHQKRRAQDLRDSFVDGIIAAQDEERRRIARELHDELGQALISLSLGLEHVKGCNELDEVRSQAAKLQGVTEQLALGLSRLAHGLFPYILEDLGFAVAVERHVAERAHADGFEAHVELIGLDGDPLPKRVAGSLFRIVQEAMTNIVKHAEASNVSVLIHKNEARVRMVIEDDGCGFDPSAVRGGLGLGGIRERAKLLGGWAEVESKKTGGGREGTVLIVQIPIELDAT